MSDTAKGKIEELLSRVAVIEMQLKAIRTEFESTLATIHLEGVVEDNVESPPGTKMERQEKERKPQGEQTTKAEQAIRLIDDWLADASGYDEQTWPTLKESLEKNRSAGSRKLFKPSR